MEKRIEQFIRDDIVSEIIEKDNYWIEDIEDETTLIYAEFRRKLYFASLPTWLVRACKKYDAKNTLIYLVNDCLKKIVNDIIEDIAKEV